MCTELCDKVFNSVQNQESVRRSIQLTTTKYLRSTTNFTLDESAKNKIKKVTLKKLDAQPRKHDEEIVFSTDPGTSGTNESNNEVETLVKENLIETADAIVGSDCPSCAEKGVSCVGRCPTDRKKME
ncbi:unnamed protein product [Parnassius apollo]|uniref:(apollo) hypothetical protein n=1 Tax=Parnassius apollo TaxID=110799 RepID=A0A8S3XRL2_PARAO|nr:unnamed protein product [Parnassius apollo]